jgi:small-conductance mechanosensitive channel
MDLAKLVVAMGIAVLLSLFFNNAVSTFYKAPKLDYSACYNYNSGSTCSDLVKEQCGLGNYSCRNDFYDGQEYRDCLDNQRSSSTNCIADQTKKIQNYALISYIILAVIALVLLMVGFRFIDKASIGSGFIGAGILLIVFSGFLSTLNSLFSGFFGGVSSMLTSTLSNTSEAAKPGLAAVAMPYVNLVVFFLALFTLISLANLRLENRPREFR